MRLIDADALKKAFKNKGEGMFKLSRVRDIINNAPTVELATNLQSTCNNLQQRTQGDLISREYIEGIVEELENICQNAPEEVLELLSKVKNAPTVEAEKILVANVTFDKDELNRLIDERVIEPIKNGELVIKEERPQGEYVDISKLRLMTVEECAGHTIDYAMGWKACIEWIKKGGAE